MKVIYHITSRQEAEAAGNGEYRAKSLQISGFIHCSYAHQLVRVADFNFRSQDGLVLFEIDRETVPCRVVDENLEGGTSLFPHIYGPLPMSSVVRIHDFPRGPDGRFVLPPGVSG